MMDETVSLLSRPYRLGREIRRQECLVAELKSGLLPSAIRYDKDPVQSTPDDPMSKVFGRISELEEKIKLLRIQRAEATVDVSRMIEMLEDTREREVMTYYYAMCLHADEIADMMGYSSRQIFRIRKTALQKMSVNVSRCQ